VGLKRPQNIPDLTPPHTHTHDRNGVKSREEPFTLEVKRATCARLLLPAPLSCPPCAPMKCDQYRWRLRAASSIPTYVMATVSAGRRAKTSARARCSASASMAKKLSATGLPSR